MASIVSGSCSSSIWFAHSNRSYPRREVLLASCTWHYKQGKIADRRTENTANTAHETATSRQKVTEYTLPARVKRLALLDRCGPLLLPAHRQFRKLLASGDLYCSVRCFGVHLDVCLKRGSSPPLQDPRTVGNRNAVDSSLLRSPLNLTRVCCHPKNRTRLLRWLRR